MAVPSDPTVADIVTEGLKRAGLPNPTATQISDATDHQFREVKSDIMTYAGRLPILRTMDATAHTQYEIEVDQPSDCDTVESVELFDVGTGKAGTITNWRGTAQSGSTTTIVLASGMSLGENDPPELIGKYLFITGGTGSGQYAAIGAYVDATDTVTFDRTLTTAPDSTSTYVIGKERYVIFNANEPVDRTLLLRNRSTELGLPREAFMIGEKLVFDRIPNVDVGLLWTYWADMDRLDETGATFVSIIREYRSLFIEGVAVKSMQRYDDARYDNEVFVYQAMLDALNQKVAELGKSTMNRDQQIIDALITQSGRISPNLQGTGRRNPPVGLVDQRNRFGNQ